MVGVTQERDLKIPNLRIRSREKSGLSALTAQISLPRRRAEPRHRPPDKAMTAIKADA